MNAAQLKQLICDMTLEEKAAQLTQIPMSAITGDPGDPTGPAAKYHLSRQQLLSCGSLICDQTPDAAVYADVVHQMTEGQEHHIPPILMRDIIHGFQTVFPIPLALGCSFDAALAEKWDKSARRKERQGASMPPLPLWWMWCGTPGGAE